MCCALFGIYIDAQIYKNVEIKFYLTLPVKVQFQQDVAAS